MIRGPGSRHIGPWSTDLEPWVVGRIPRFKLRGSRLGDAGPGLLGLVARSESNWVEGEARLGQALRLGPSLMPLPLAKRKET